MFIFNSLKALGNALEAGGNDNHQPGQPVVLRADSEADSIEVTAPDRTSKTLKRSMQGTFIDNDANQTGVCHGRRGRGGALTCVVNLFDARESNLAPRGLAPDGLSMELYI